MKTKKLCMAALVAIFCCTHQAQGQTGPLWYDHLFPRGWENPVKDLNPDAVESPYNPSDVLNQYDRVATVKQLAQGHKDYYVFPSPDKVNGTIEIKYISPKQRNIVLLWGPPEFPNDPPYEYPDFGTTYEALDFSLYNQNCFQPLSGPYSSLSDSPVYIGLVDGFPVFAFYGLGRIMGKSFLQYQIEKVKEKNKENNLGPLKSDLRPELVQEFLNLNQNYVYSADIPIDANFSASSAEVCHIIPAICPRDPAENPDMDPNFEGQSGTGCGRNAYQNAVLVSSGMKSQLLAMPKPGLILYMQYLANKYKPKKTNPIPPQKFYFEQIRDLSQLRGLDLDYLDEDETRSALEYGKLLQESERGQPTPAPVLQKTRG